MLAVGVSGDDGSLLLAKKKLVGGRDIGFVGEITAVNTKIIEDLIKEDFIPVVASVAAGEDGASYNINADQVAGRIAAALGADKLIFLTDVDGIYRDYATQRELISELTLTECTEIFEKRRVSEGMVPKIEGCIIALKNGVRRAHILNGTKPHALLLEIFTDKGIGTMILP
jgi:acetylglutamate kinase